MLFRAYINAKKGGEHVRVYDGEAEDLDAFLELAEGKLKATEEIGDIVRLHDPEPPEAARNDMPHTPGLWSRGDHERGAAEDKRAQGPGLSSPGRPARPAARAGRSR